MPRRSSWSSTTRMRLLTGPSFETRRAWVVASGTSSLCPQSIQPRSATMHFDDLFGNGQAEAGAILGLGVAIVDLVELFEIAGSLQFRYDGTGFRHSALALLNPPAHAGRLACSQFDLPCVWLVRGLPRWVWLDAASSTGGCEAWLPSLGPLAYAARARIWWPGPQGLRTVWSRLSVCADAQLFHQDRLCAPLRERRIKRQQ